MSREHLATYLNDHLAGSVTAVELLEYLERVRAGTPDAAFAAALRADILADRGELEVLMGRLGVTPSRPRKAAAWVAERMTELKLRADDPSAGALRRLEVVEAVSVGVEGKRLLWRALAEAAGAAPALRGTDYARLERRAEEQRARIEAVRVEAARAALGVDRAPD